MAGFKESFTKGLTTINMKTSNFMEESKIKTHISSLENEINTIELNFGRSIFEKWKNGADYKEGMEETLNLINSKYMEIETQKQNIEKLHEEEKQVLGTQQAQPVAPAPGVQQAQPVAPAPETQQAAAQGKFCPACGSLNDPNYKFCCKCGNALN
jgi:formate dehydrogenase maturation protein FdhE